MSNISLKQLEVLIAVVECGNFTEAAEHMYLAQSTVSSNISALEEALHVMLFRRESKKGVTPTADGSAFTSMPRTWWGAAMRWNPH